MASPSFVWILIGVLGVVIDGVRAQIPTSTRSPVTTFPATTAVPTSSAFPSPVLRFQTIQPAIACHSSAITWVYDGPSAPLTLTVTNQNVSASSAPSSTSSTTLRGGRRHVNYQELAIRKGSADSVISQTLTTSADPFELSFTWSQVNIPQGTYAIVAKVDGFSTQSASFLVINGTDVSCLGGSSSSSSTTASPSSTSSNSPFPDLSRAGTISRKSYVGAIAGGAAGGVFILLAIAAFLLLSKSRNKKRSTTRRQSDWVGLGSKDSTVDDKDLPPASPARSKKYSHTTSESVGASAGTSALGHSLNRSEGDIDGLSPPRVPDSSMNSDKPFPRSDPFEDVAAFPSRSERSHRRASSSSRHSHAPSYSLSYKRGSLDGYGPDSIQTAHHPPSSISSNTRRAMRKAVPQYSIDQNESQPGTSAESGSSLTSNGGFGESSLVPAQAGLSQTTLPNGFGPKGEVLASDPTKPVHFLIPDMPSGGVSRT